MIYAILALAMIGIASIVVGKLLGRSPDPNVDVTAFPAFAVGAVALFACGILIIGEVVFHATH